MAAPFDPRMMSTRLVAALALLALPSSLLAQQRAPSAKSVFTQTAVLAGGCFWGVEAVYEHTKGIVDVVSGFARGDRAAPAADRNPPAESVRITFDPSRITYEQILEIFFSVSHDPTQLNRQGPDVGPQYRSAIYFSDRKQEAAARDKQATERAAQAGDTQPGSQATDGEQAGAAQPKETHGTGRQDA